MDEFSSSSSEDDLHLQNQRDRGRFRRGSEGEYQERRRRIREAQKVYPVSSSTPCGEGRYWQDVLADYLKVQRRNSGKLSIIGDEPNHTDSGSPIVQRAASIRMVTAEEEAAKQAAMQTPELDKTPAKPSIAVDAPETSDQETNTTKRITNSSSTTELLANFKFDTTKFPFTPHFNPFRSMPGNDAKKPNEGEETSGTNSTNASKEAHDSANVSERPSAENLRESLSFYRFSEANIRAVCQGQGNAEKLLGSSKNEPMLEDKRQHAESPHELEYRSDGYMQRQRGRRTTSAEPPRNAKQRNSNGSSRSKSSMIRRKVSGNFFPKTAGDRWKVFVESRGTSTDNSVRPRYQPVYQQKQQQEQQQQARRRMSRLNCRQASDKGTSTSAERSKIGKKSNAPARHTEIGLEEEGIAQRIIGDDIRTSRMPVMDEDQGQNMQEPGRQPEVVAEKQQIIRRSQGEANTGPIKQEPPIEANPQRVDVSQQTREDTRGQGDATGSTQRSETPADRRSNSMENRTSDGQKRSSQGVAAELKPPAKPPRQRIDLSTVYRRNDSNARGFYNFLNLYRQRNPLLSYSASKKMASEIYRQLDPNTKKYYYRMRTFVRRVESIDPVLETLAAAKLASDLVPDSSFTSRAEALHYPNSSNDPRNVTSGEFDENRECLNLLKRCRSVGYMNYLEEYRNRNRDVPFTKAIKVSAAIYLYLSKSAKQRYRAMNRRSRALKPECEEQVVEEVPISMTVRFSDSGSIEINATSDILNNFADDECYDGCDSSDSSSDVLDAESEADEEDEKEKDEDLSDEDNDEDKNCDEDPDDNRADDERADDEESNEDQDSSSCSDAVGNLGHIGVSSFLEALRDKKLRNRFESNSYDADKSSSVSSCRDHEESDSDIRTGYENDNGAELDVQSSKSSQITCNSFSGVSSIDILQEIEDEEMEGASDEDDDDDETEKEEDEQDDYATCQNSDSEYEHCELEDGEESDGSNRDNGDDDNRDDDDNDDHEENRDNEPLPVNTADRIAAAAAFAKSLSAKRKNIRSNEQLDSETSTMQTMTNHHCDKCHNELKELPNINRQQKRVRVGQCPICEKIFCYRK